MTMEELKTEAGSGSPTAHQNDSGSPLSEDVGAQEELSTPMERTETILRPNENVVQCCIDDNWGLSLDELFDMAQIFLKEKDGKAFHPTYEEKLRFVALHKQASQGPYNPDACPEVGFFDLLGNDRRKEWANLGQMTKEDAMVEFIKLLNACCPLFSPYVVSHKIEKEEQERKRKEEEERLRLEREELERRRREEEERLREEEEQQQREEAKRRQEEEERLRMEQQKQQIMAALNAQTSVQFQQYAAQHFPDQPEQQQLLIQQLQEQHYQQYIQQAYQLQQQQQTPLETQQAGADAPVAVAEKREQSEACMAPQDESVDAHLDTRSSSPEETDMATPRGISTPSMWTRPHIKDFKEKMYNDTDSIITVGRGEVLTVRVPTNEDGNYMFWEFATDHYDIGFGLYFEWTDSPAGSSSLSTVTEPTDEDPGNGEPQETANVTQTPLTEEVVPVYRRDSHEEVYAGSHQYPGQGTYLLKFDNSYSLWRSKVVYYRVYYTR